MEAPPNQIGNWQASILISVFYFARYQCIAGRRLFRWRLNPTRLWIKWVTYIFQVNKHIVSSTWIEKKSAALGQDLILL